MLPGGAPEAGERQRAMASLIFIILWCALWGAGTVAWAWWRWRHHQKTLAQFREIKRLLREEAV
jgi:DNA-binding transcriptional regulator of glucitol operon